MTNKHSFSSPGIKCLQKHNQGNQVHQLRFLHTNPTIGYFLLLQIHIELKTSKNNNNIKDNRLIEVALLRVCALLCCLFKLINDLAIAKINKVHGIPTLP